MTTRKQVKGTTTATMNGSPKKTSKRRQAASTAEIAPAKPQRPQLVWNDDAYPSVNYDMLANELAKSGDLYRDPDGGLTCLKVSGNSSRVKKGADLLPIIVDRIDVAVVKGGKSKGGKIDAAHLNAMLRSELFLKAFPTVDVITKAPLYLPDFSITNAGYNDGGDEFRIFYVNRKPEVSSKLDAINAFLDVMEFGSDADRTNAVALALTVTLRNHFPGGKPVAIVTANKSHGGKDTVILFGVGIHQGTSISFQTPDWPLERNFVVAVKSNPELAVVTIENARLAGRQGSICSAFLERFVTDAKPLLSCPGTGEPVQRRNEIVTAISTNYGIVSEDLMNRGLPIHLESHGDIAHRESPIGNPKLEYLPKNKDRIAAELRGMIERWKNEGRPLDNEVRHPSSVWAETIGGILKVNGFRGFLSNYGVCRTTIDPIRQHLGFLGATEPDKWLTPSEWAPLAVQHGHKKMLIPPADQDTDAGQTRGIGVVLSAHQGETFETETETKALTLRLQKKRFRKPGDEPRVRYRFEVLSKASIPADLETNEA